MINKSQIQQTQNIAIFAHINPDGDAIGSSLALQKLLQNMWKNAQVFLSHKPKAFDFLPWFEKIQTEFNLSDNQNNNNNNNNKYDLIFVLDCGEISRVAPFYPENKNFFENNKIIVIDHHIPASKWFWVDTIDFFEKPSYSSTCGYIFDLFFNDYNQYFDNDIATNLFFGIYTDTGWFTHEEDTINVFNTCSKLFELWANKPLIIDKFVKWKTFQETKLLGEIINRATYEWDILYTHYDTDEFTQYWIDNTPKLWYDTLSKINWPKALVIAKKDWNKIRFWMRSKWKYNVQQIAVQFNGGGHKYASWFSIDLEDDQDYLEITKTAVKKINNLINNSQ